MLNLTDEVNADININRATGDALLRLARHYGFERPQYIPEEDFRTALRAAVYGSQPTFGTLFKFLISMFDVWADYSTITGEATSTQTLELSTASLALTDSEKNFEQRYALIDGKVCYLAVSLAGFATFANVNTSYFTKPNFTVGQTYTAKLLPFNFEEFGCKVKLILDGGIFNVASVYLQENATQNQNVGEPPYGYLMDFFSTNTEERFGRPNGPYPAYLATDFFENDFFNSVDKMLAAGVQLRGQNVLWVNGVQSMYNSFTQLLQGGEAGGPLFSIAADRV